MEPDYLFGPFCLDPRTRSLRRDGAHVEVTPKMMDVLLVFVRNQGRLVRKDEFLRTVWPGAVVEENNLSVTVSKLRSVLEAKPGDRRYIETVPRQGYRFRASVQEGGQDLAVGTGRPPSTSTTEGWLPRIAVLPLQSAPGDEFIADGILDALITALGRIRALRVISHQSVRRFRDSDLSLKEVAAALDVDFVIEGSVLRNGGLLKTSLRLLDSDDELLWGNQYDGAPLETLNLTGEAARAVARHIAVKLTPQEEGGLRLKDYVDPKALELYLRGRYFVQRNNEESIRKAYTCFLDATRHDSGYAAAYAGASHAAFLLGLFGASPTGEAMREATSMAEQAIALDPTLPEAHVSLGLCHEFFSWNWAAAEQAFRRATALYPAGSIAHYELGALLARIGRVEEGVAAIEHALAFDPLSLNANHLLAEAHYYGEAYEAAIAAATKGLELAPAAAWPQVLLGLSYVQCRRIVEGLRALRRAVTVSGEHPFTLGSLGYGHAVAGDLGAARRLLLRLEQQFDEGIDSAIFAGFVHVGLGEDVEAIRWFERAYASRSQWILCLGIDPRLRHLRSNGAFVSLLHRLRLPSAPAAAEA